MLFLFGLALRNLYRNFRRSVITSLAVVFGVAIQIFGWGMVNGLDENVIRASSGSTTGDILLRPEGYPDDGISFPPDKAAAPPEGLAAQVDGDIAPRTLFDARLVKGAEDSRVRGIAYDADLDPKVFPRDAWSIQGAWPAPGALEVTVGSGLARLLKIAVGDDVVVETRTVDGAMNALTYKVAGIVQTENLQLDNLGLWVEKQTASDLLQLQGRVTHIAIRLHHGEPEDAIGKIQAPGWVAHTVREECADLLAVNSIRRVAIEILVIVIMLIAALGIFNTVMMAAYERVREIGTLLALGMRKSQVGQMFMLEGAVLGVIAGVTGAVIGSVGVLYFQAHGIDFGSAMGNAAKDMPISTIVYLKFSWGATLGALGFSAVIAELASFLPARFAANLIPADAVRAE